MPVPELNVVLAIAFGLVILYLVAKTLVIPARLLLMMLANVCVGGVILLFFNLAAGLLGAAVGINVVTALIVGYMGVPGLVMLVLLQRMLG